MKSNYTYLIAVVSMLAFGYPLTAMEDGENQNGKAEESSNEKMTEQLALQKYEELKKTLGYDPKVRVAFMGRGFLGQAAAETVNHNEGTFALDKIKPDEIIGYHHGWGDSGEGGIDAFQYLVGYKLGSFLYAFDFPDCKERGDIDYSKTNLAQHADVNVASEIAQYINTLYQPKLISLWGFSRGGGVVLGLAGRKEENNNYIYLTDEIRNKMKYIVLEAPLVSVPDAIAHIVETSVSTQISSVPNSVHHVVSSYIPDSIRNAAHYLGGSKVARAVKWFYEGMTSPSPCSSGSTAKALSSVMMGRIIKDYKSSSFTPLECVKHIDPSLSMFMFTTREDQLIASKTLADICSERFKHTSNTLEKTFAWVAPKGGHGESSEYADSIYPALSVLKGNLKIDNQSTSVYFDPNSLDEFKKIPAEEWRKEQEQNSSDSLGGNNNYESKKI